MVCRDQSHYKDPDLNLAVTKRSHPVLATAVSVSFSIGLSAIFKTRSTSVQMDMYLAFILINEVSKCSEINCSSFDNHHFPLEDVNIQIWVLKATD